MKLLFLMVKAVAYRRRQRERVAIARQNVKDFEVSLNYWRQRCFEEEAKLIDAERVVSDIRTELTWPRPSSMSPYRTGLLPRAMVTNADSRACAHHAEVAARSRRGK